MYLTWSLWLLIFSGDLNTGGKVQHVFVMPWYGVRPTQVLLRYDSIWIIIYNILNIHQVTVETDDGTL